MTHTNPYAHDPRQTTVCHMELQPYWNLVFNFMTKIIGDSPPSNHTTAIINMWTRNKLGTPIGTVGLRLPTPRAFG